MAQNRILLIDNEEGLCRMMEAVLSDHGFEVRSHTRSFEAVEEFTPGAYDLVVSDIKMPGMDGIEVLQRIKEKDPEVPVIMITAYATVEMSIQALRKGAYDMLTKPFEPEELLYRVRNALAATELIEENRELKQELAGKFDFDNIIGASGGLEKVLEMVKKIAGRDTAVLISGESGTGKELIAQAIHYNSPRREQRFMAINCGSLPESLLESELFGHKKGAFTGAGEDRAGLIEAADGGTLFLDEVGNLPMSMQKSLLRVVQEQEFMRIGDTRPTRVDVRLISATNADLMADVERGDFREDLYYRLNVVNLHLPPLRERKDDLSLLIAHFVREQNKRFGTAIKGFSPEAMQAARAYHWPGNIRQLRNVIEASMAMESGDTVSRETVAQFIDAPSSHGGESAPQENAEISDYATKLARFEVDYLRRILEQTRGNVEAAAAIAEMNMATIYRKMKRYGLRKEDFS